MEVNFLFWNISDQVSLKQFLIFLLWKNDGYVGGAFKKQGPNLSWIEILREIMPIFTGEVSLEDNKKGQLFWLMHIYFKFLHATLLLGTLEPLGGE